MTKRGRFKNWVHKHKTGFTILAIVFVILLFVFGAKLWLLLNLMLGNDIIVTLGVDKHTLDVSHGDEAKVEFKAKVTTNPFCVAECSSVFSDISSEEVIDQDSFELRPAVPFIKEYSLGTSRLGHGIDFYRFSMECKSVESTLCHTKGESTTRNILITIKHGLNEKEKETKAELKEKLEMLITQIEALNSKIKAVDSTIGKLNQTIPVDRFEFKSIEIKDKLEEYVQELDTLQELWYSEDYSTLLQEFKSLYVRVQDTENKYTDLEKAVLFMMNTYNPLLDRFTAARTKLGSFDSVYLDNTTLIEVSSLITEFNPLIESFEKKTTITEKKTIVDSISAKVGSLETTVNTEIKEKSIKKELELDVFYDALCEIYDRCVVHIPITELAVQEEFDLDTVCAKIDNLILDNAEFLIEINDSLSSYPSGVGFWDNISLMVDELKDNITLTYLEELIDDQANTALIKKNLILTNALTEAVYPYNLSSALVKELIKDQPEECEQVTATLPALNEINVKKSSIEEALPYELDIEFNEPSAKCCVFGECQPCCGEECNDYSPIVFLHGHAFNKDTSAEYSLDAFNKIQRKLEQDGYLDAGAVSLYTPKDIELGIWGKPKVSMTIKASYYIDFFHESDDYIAVQTKSESINTYALRLKELVETIQLKTGRPKIILVAHSMGGLVARRYLDLFGGDKVAKLIMIGTPNKGIAGKTAEYCPFVGEKLECRDMGADSLFMNKLSQANLPSIPVHMIVGTGCDMDGAQGDGVVTEENAKLEAAENHVIEGTCTKTSKLHTEMLDIDKYPGVYDLIKVAVEG